MSQLRQHTAELLPGETGKSDRRVVKTHHSLAQSLIKLSLQRGYDTITIRDITEHAKVGYATFFRHYADKESLLSDVLTVFIAELTELLNSQIEKSDVAQQGEVIFAYIQKHKALSRLLLTSRSRAEVVRAIQRSQNNMSSVLTGASEKSAVPTAIAYHHWISATISLIEWWLENENSLTPQRMGEIYRDLIVLPTLRIGLE